MRYFRLTQYSLRVTISRELFVEVYYNDENKRQSYALISKDKRRFGCDNLLDWHYHPRGNPEQHDFCGKPPSLEEVFTELKNAVDLVRGGE